MDHLQQRHWRPYVVHGMTHPGVEVDDGMDEADGAVFLARLRPDGRTIPHVHSGTERIDILCGTAELTCDGVCTRYGPGASVRVAPGTCHSLRNAGDDHLYVRATFDPPFSRQSTVLAQRSASSGDGLGQHRESDLHGARGE